MLKMTEEDSKNNNIKLCECGCGQSVKFYRKKPNRFINGHCHRGNYHHKWKNGRRITNGYVMIIIRDHPFATCRGYVLEHRLVMEKFLGRYLDPKEVVHHKNSIRHDNRIENLILFSNNSEHLRHELTGKKRNI